MVVIVMLFKQTKILNIIYKCHKDVSKMLYFELKLIKACEKERKREIFINLNS